MMWAATKGAYMLTVQPDDFFPDPRRENENFGTMLCFHRRYNLGDEHNYSSSGDLIKDLYIKAAGGGEKGERKYNELIERFDDWHMTSQQIQAMNRELMSEIEKAYAVLPVYLYDHSGLSMSTDSFVGRAPHAEWDSGQVGIIFVSNADICKEYDVKEVTPEILQKAESLLRGEVEDYDAYLRGECYCYELYKDGELEHSCGGFIGSFDKACKDIADYLPDGCEDMTEDLSETNDSPSMIQTLRKHSNILVEQAQKDHSRQPRQQTVSVEL